MKRQRRYSEMNVWVDTDDAGCRDTRKSTSGGVILAGEHMIKGWSSTQSVIALSSGEAEYDGMVKGTSNAIGVRGIMQDIGIQSRIRLMTDSAAAVGVAKMR